MREADLLSDTYANPPSENELIRAIEAVAESAITVAFYATLTKTMSVKAANRVMTALETADLAKEVMQEVGYEKKTGFDAFMDAVMEFLAKEGIGVMVDKYAPKLGFKGNIEKDAIKEGVMNIRNTVKAEENQ